MQKTIPLLAPLHTIILNTNRILTTDILDGAIGIRRIVITVVIRQPGRHEQQARRRLQSRQLHKQPTQTDVQTLVQIVRPLDSIIWQRQQRSQGIARVIPIFARRTGDACDGPQCDLRQVGREGDVLNPVQDIACHDPRGEVDDASISDEEREERRVVGVLDELFGDEFADEGDGVGVALFGMGRSEEVGARGTASGGVAVRVVVVVGEEPAGEDVVAYAVGGDDVFVDLETEFFGEVEEMLGFGFLGLIEWHLSPLGCSRLSAVTNS